MGSSEKKDKKEKRAKLDKLEKKEKKDKKEKKAKKAKKEKKEKENKSELKLSRKRKQPCDEEPSSTSITSSINSNFKGKPITFPYRYILAPMVGASELPFRLLCRKYGAQLAYTPMISSSSFVSSSTYRAEELQTIPQDRPLVVHFSANDPKTFAQAAKLVEDKCDAIDLNLGCPQRTAYVGHFGSYLLNDEDRPLILDIVKTGNEAVRIPIFVKIRLLNTLEETILLCQQLRDAGASLIAIHARYRAGYERKGPGARDGPALLDQVLKIKQVVTDIPIIANGNIITYEDVEKNLDFTKADGVMSAEGILDNPAIFLPRLGSAADKKTVEVINITKQPHFSNTQTNITDDCGGVQQVKKKRKLMKKIREINKIEEKISGDGTDKTCLNEAQKAKLASKAAIQQDLMKLEKDITKLNRSKETDVDKPPADLLFTPVPLQQLYDSASDEVGLAKEYLILTKTFPATIRTQIFHTRRICRDILKQYQLMEECVGSKSTADLESVLTKIEKYRKDPKSFTFDKEKEKRDQMALERKRHEEGKRKAYEARMIRKAKREKKSDLEFYLRQGAEVPTVATLKRLKTMTKEKQLLEWKKGNHSQHCMAFHLEGCKRDRACAFLHVNAKGTNSFDEADEVAG